MIELDGRSLTLAQVEAVAAGGETCSLSQSSRQRIEVGRRAIEAALASGEAVYGLNTGFGNLASVRISHDQLAELQERLILSHAAGMGEPLPAPAVRGMLLLRANTLAQGHSGVRPLVVEALLRLLEADVLPVVPSRGSVGASGDLAPLAHLALPLLGRGAVTISGREATVAEGLARAGLEPLTLGPKEGLALINGTQAMTALTALAALECRRLVKIADLVGALSVDALRGTDTAFDARIHDLRPHPGQLQSARNLRRLLEGSEIRDSHRQGDVRVQDPYCLRCMPQVHGAARDLLSHVMQVLAVEMNAVTDNPLVFPDPESETGGGDLLSGGNFHGEPVAMGADILALGAAELGAIAERRVEKLTNSSFSGLPPFLVEDAGLNSGFMIAQVTAAALASENKVLCHPASCDSIPTSADKEDHVSMGMGAALKLGQVVSNTRRILAIELVAAAQGVDLLRPLRSSRILEKLHQGIRQVVEPWVSDREMSPDLEAGEKYLRSEVKELLEALE